MPRFITVNLQCDWAECSVEAPETTGEVVEKTVSLDGKQTRAFLICKQHLEDFEEILLPLLQAGVKVEEPAKKVDKFKVGRLMRQNVGEDDDEPVNPAPNPLRRSPPAAAQPSPPPAPPAPPKPPPSNSPF